MDIAVLGIDLGKNNCSVVGLDGSGTVILRRRMQRKTIVELTSKLSPCIVAMEACCGAHHLGRVLLAQGHTVRLMSPEYVRPCVKAPMLPSASSEGSNSELNGALSMNDRLEHLGWGFTAAGERPLRREQKD
jgi:transposase